MAEPQTAQIHVDRKESATTWPGQDHERLM
jgi:hypothetical protein